MPAVNWPPGPGTDRNIAKTEAAALSHGEKNVLAGFVAVWIDPDVGKAKALGPMQWFCDLDFPGVQLTIGATWLWSNEDNRVVDMVRARMGGRALAVTCWEWRPGDREIELFRVLRIVPPSRRVAEAAVLAAVEHRFRGHDPLIGRYDTTWSGW